MIKAMPAFVASTFILCLPCMRLIPHPHFFPLLMPAYSPHLPLQVMALMGMEKGGPALGQLMERVVDWQLCHPKGTPEECKQFLLAHHSGMADMTLK